MFLFRNTFANGAIWISILYYMLAYWFAPEGTGVTLSGVFVFVVILAVTEVYNLFWGGRNDGY